MDIFSFMYEPFKFDTNKKIRVFESFAGIGTQLMALKRLPIDLEVVGISEIDEYALKSYRAIHGDVKNYGGIGDFDFPKKIDIATWSFPCTDISLAGQQKGMVDGTSSNYGYVFLDEIKKLDFEDRPQVLLMENVKALVSKTFEEDYILIHQKLEEMGYESFGEVLNAKDFNVPQNRERIFVISIKNSGGGQKHSYSFPKPVKLKNKLMDYLEDKVDEKYFISDKMVDYLTNSVSSGGMNRAEMFRPIHGDTKVVRTITTSGGSRPTDNFVLVPEATKKGYSKAYLGDGVYIDRPHQKRGVVQRSMIPTIKTTNADLGVVVRDLYKQGKLNIRKITPLETWRLMGISDEDFIKAQSSGISDTQLYKQAGNAIVVNVLESIFKELLRKE